jgi:hypothetical protein
VSDHLQNCGDRIVDMARISKWRTEVHTNHWAELSMRVCTILWMSRARIGMPIHGFNPFFRDSPHARSYHIRIWSCHVKRRLKYSAFSWMKEIFKNWRNQYIPCNDLEGVPKPSLASDQLQTSGINWK